MTKHVATCKNMVDGHEQEEVEEETTALGSDVRTVRKLTGETPDAQSVREVTGAVMEGGRNSTKHMGASPMMPVNREM